MLVKGASITLPGGTVVHPSQVLGPPTPGIVVIVVDCPSLPHAKALVAQKSFAPYFPGSSNGIVCYSVWGFWGVGGSDCRAKYFVIMSLASRFPCLNCISKFIAGLIR